MTIQIPNEYAACEEYRGFVIATRNTWYFVFCETNARWTHSYASRACARKDIDTIIEARG